MKFSYVPHHEGTFKTFLQAIRQSKKHVLYDPICVKCLEQAREFPGRLVVRILGFQCCGLSSVLVWGAEILCHMAKTPLKKQRKPCNKCVHHQSKLSRHPAFKTFSVYNVSIFLYIITISLLHLMKNSNNLISDKICSYSNFLSCH